MWENIQTIFEQSLERAVTALARVAPGLLALLVVFAVSGLLATYYTIRGLRERREERARRGQAPD